MVKQSLVKPLEPSEIAVFVSHQWLGRSHPDPDGTQLRSLQRFMRAAAVKETKDFFSPSDWETLKGGTNPRKSNRVASFRSDIADAFSRYTPETDDDVVASELAASFIWLDYFSVPQMVASDDSSQMRAVYSIPYYVLHSSFFFVLCPRVQHVDTD